MRGGNPALADPLADLLAESLLFTKWKQKKKVLDDSYKQLEVESIELDKEREELKRKINELERKVDELEKQIQAKERKIDELEKQIKANTFDPEKVEEKEEYTKNVTQLHTTLTELIIKMKEVYKAWEECTKKRRQNLDNLKENFHQRSLNIKTLEPKKI
jgi:chromosome segregation ATPase